MRMRELTVVLFAVAALGLSACGTTPTDRGLTGAGLGAAGGAIIGALVGGPLAGALVGAAALGATGVITDQEDVDLGPPVWEDPFWD